MTADIELKDPAAMNWHFDRRIPLALIVTIVAMLAGQTIGIVWWASSVNQRVEASFQKGLELDAADQAMALQIKEVQSANNDVNLRLVRFEVLLEGQTEQLREQRVLLTQIRDSVGQNRSPP